MREIKQIVFSESVNDQTNELAEVMIWQHATMITPSGFQKFKIGFNNANCILKLESFWWWDYKISKKKKNDQF